MIRLKKIRAGAIQYVLVVSVIIVILLFAFVSFFFLQKRVQSKSELFKTTIRSTYLAFDYIGKKNISYDREEAIQFSDFQDEQTSIIKKHWGIFDLAIVNSKIKNESFQKVALLGNHNTNRKALHLQDNNQPLVVVGNTIITGDAILPRRGIKTGNIAGNSYYGSKLIYGSIQSYANKLPGIQNLSSVQNLLQGSSLENTESFLLEENAQISQSFAKKTLLFESEFPLELRETNLQGNIILISREKVRIFSSAKLKNILIIAPEIIVEKEASISCQLLATTRIEIKEQSMLNYPSSLVILNENFSKSNPQEQGIQIRKNAQVKGVVVYSSQDEERNGNANIHIEEKATITGDVYSNQNLDLQGTVLGTVYTKHFVARQSGGIFINHLYNGKINSKLISEEFCGLFVGNQKLKVAKWLD